MSTPDDRLAEEAIRSSGGQVFLAAERLKCPPLELLDRVRLSETLRGLVESARGRMVDAAEVQLHRAILSGESWAVKLVLQALGGDRGYADAKTRDDPHSASVPELLASSGCPSVQAVLDALMQDDQYLEYCRSRHQPASQIEDPEPAVPAGAD